jgi:hypothetical protein
MLCRRVEKQTGQRLPASAPVPVIVIADENVVQRELSEKKLVYALHLFSAARSAADVRLICNYHKKKTVLFQTL